MKLEAGTLLSGKYRIVRRLGDGGMGIVYEARHEILKSAVALKFLHDEYAKNPHIAARFLREARVAATISSPHVGRVYDVDVAPDGVPIIVMELLGGESLQALLTRERRLSESTTIDFALQILSGLEAAHALGVVHRDLKPDNVFVTPGGQGPLLKIIDFGIAKAHSEAVLTQAGTIMGTPEYMAPEQFYSAAEVDARADIYSLGVMLFEMLSGDVPASGNDPQEIISRVLAGNVKHLQELLPSVSRPLAHAVEQATAREREARFASAFAMRTALVACRATLPAEHAGNFEKTQGMPAIADLRVSRTPTTEPDHAAAKAAPAQYSTERVPVRLIEQAVQERLPSALPPEASANYAARGSHLPSALPAAPTMRRKPPKASGLWLILGASTLLVCGLVFSIYFYRLSNSDDAPPMPTALPTTRVNNSLPTAPPTLVEPPLLPPVTPPVAPPPNVPTRRPDAGTPTNVQDAGPTFPPNILDGGLTIPPLGPFTLPSVLPPWPSALPPLPVGLPTSLPNGFPSVIPPLPGIPTALPQNNDTPK